jgi:O-antigen ligase
MLLSKSPSSTASSRGSALQAGSLQPKPTKIGFGLVLLALLFEFGRPQDFFPPLKVVPMPFANNNFWALMVFKDMTLYFFFYLGIVTFVNTTSRMQTLIFVWLGVHLVLAVNGILHQGRGVGGWLGDENDFGMEMNVAIPVAFFMSQGAVGKGNKLIYVGSLGLFVMALVATSSRGGFLGLLAVGAYCWLFSSRKLMSLFLGVCLVGLVLVAAPQEYWDRISTITDDKTTESGTAGQRMFTWGIGWEMFLANPILGIGQGNFAWTIGEYLGGRTWQTKSLAGRQAHSLYFTLLPELGLVGVLIFGSMVYLNLRDARLKALGSWSGPSRKVERANDPQFARAVLFGKAISGGMIGYLATSAFISTLYYPTFWIMMALAVALRNTTERYVAAEAVVIEERTNYAGPSLLRQRPAK